MDLTSVHIFVFFHLMVGNPPTMLDLYERTFDTMAECATYVGDHTKEVGDTARDSVRDFLQAMHAPPGVEPADMAFGCRGKDKTTI
jgi:hypothetical protein